MADYTQIDRPYDAVSNRIPGGTSPVLNEINSLFNTSAAASSEVDTSTTPSDTTYDGTQGTATNVGNVETQQVNTGQSLPDLYIKSFIRSQNFKAGAIGFNISGETGSAEFNNVLVRGTIYASIGNIGGWTIGLTTLTGGGITLDAANQRIDVGNNNPYIVIDGSAKTIGTSTFVSGQIGWRISGTGDAEFNNIVARGEFRTSVFVKDSISATGGSFIVLGASTLLNNFTSVTSPTTSTLDLKDPPSGHTQLFAVNDILRIKDGSGLDNWLKVTVVTDNTTYYTYTVQKQSGTNGTFYAGTAVVDYKQSTDGSILLTSDLTNAPYIDIATNGATPWAGTTPNTRLGNLAGITDPIFGALSGYGLWTGSGYFSGGISATSGRIGGSTNYWNITAGSLVAVGAGDVVIRGGQTDFATGTGFWLGLKSGTPKFSIGSATNYLQWDGSSLNILGGTMTTGDVTGQYIKIDSSTNSMSFYDTTPTLFMVMGSSGGNGAINITPTSVRNNGIVVTTSQAGNGYAFSSSGTINNRALYITDGSTTNNLPNIDITRAGTGYSVYIANNGTASTIYITDKGTQASVDINKSLTTANDAVALRTNLTNSNDAARCFAFDFEGSEVIPFSVVTLGGAKIRIIAGGSTYYIPLYTV